MKLNAHELAAKRWPNDPTASTMSQAIRLAHQAACATAITEVAQPLQDRVEELEAALRLVLEDVSLVAYDGEGDECGYYTCCQTASYEKHSPECPITNARAILAKYA